MGAERYVYVLFHETNSGHAEESDGYVEAVYATEALAESARLHYIRAARDRGEAIYVDPDVPDDEGRIDWEHDWTVIPTHVLTEADVANVDPALARAHAAFEAAVQALYADTAEEAYSFDRYGATEWRRCCELLIRRGHSVTEGAALLLSKATRWAADDATTPGRGRATAEDLERHLDRRSRVHGGGR